MKKSAALLLAVVVAVISSTITYFLVIYHFNTPPSDDELAISEFSNLEQIIEENYLGDYHMKDLQYAGLKAMVAALDDPYSVYYTPEEFQSFNQEAAGEYYGIGIVIGIDEVTGLAEIQYLFNGSPAEEAGIKAGDLIANINGQDVSNMTLQEIGLLCEGEEGTAISIGVKRGDDVLAFDLVRRAITMDMLTYRMMDNEIGYMRIVQFGGNCEELFDEAMDFFEQNGTKGIAIDLRNNPGGYLNTVVNVLDTLLPEGTIVYTEDKNGNRETSVSDAACISIPLTLIVNENTASAAEIFAGAVQDYDYGTIVGTTTYGKGVVQMVIPIKSTGGGVKITVSQYFTPSGRSINGNGITPDEYVELQQGFIDNPDHYSFEEDAQVNKAIEALEAEIGK